MDRSRERCFFLAVSPDEGEPELFHEEVEHALRVLRLEVGDELLGLDGRGGAFPLRIARIDPRGRRGVELAPAGEPRREPAPGEEGASLPWLEVAAVLPRAGRAEELVDGAVQLGAAAITPIRTERAQRGASDLSHARTARLERAAREACKQSRRAWMPVIHGELALEDFVAARAHAALCVLDPRAGDLLADWARSLDRSAVGTAERPIAVLVGPEGGFAERELDELARAGLARATLGPYVLRVENAACAAIAVLVQQVYRPV